jgi:hypothetical protein
MSCKETLWGVVHVLFAESSRLSYFWNANHFRANDRTVATTPHCEMSHLNGNFFFNP